MPATRDDAAPQPWVLHTTAGDVTLDEYRLRLAGREWTVLHTGAILTHADEQRFLNEGTTRLPYGVALWPAAIALAHDVASRQDTELDAIGGAVLRAGARHGLACPSVEELVERVSDRLG